MTKFVFQDQRLHLFTRGSVLFLVAPYLFYAGKIYKDKNLILLALALLVFDSWSLVSDNSSTTTRHQWARAAGLFIQAPYMLYAARKNNDAFLGLLGVATLLGDGYTLWLGL